MKGFPSIARRPPNPSGRSDARDPGVRQWGKFYEENGNEIGAVTSSSFHSISTAVTMYADEQFTAKKYLGSYFILCLILH